MRHVLLWFLCAAALPLLACEFSSVGDACAETGCASDLSCLADFPNGFCTRECDQQGDGADCPLDTLCIFQRGSLMCAPVCTSGSDCREGYECASERGSSVRSCRVIDTPGGQSQPFPPAQSGVR